MQHKDFDGWNLIKKNVNSGDIKYYRNREIWWCKLGINVGFEQDGAGDKYERPALILRGFSRKVCLIIPLTTSEKQNKYIVPIGFNRG
jgi:mRNA interferase MazF